MQPQVKYPYKGGTRWNFMTWADIPDARDESLVYLRRLRIIQTPWFALYLHFIFVADEDRDPHDHPFNFWSFIVRGGYTERVWRIEPGKHRSIIYNTKTWRRFTFHKMPQTLAHMITNLDPGTITLVFCGPKTRQDGTADWGFYAQDGFVPWAQYNRAKYDHSSDALA